MPGSTWRVDAIAATAGPGLIGGVMVGLVTGKALAHARGKPLIAVNHLEGHALSPRLGDPDLEFPYLLLLVSGGHCQLLRSTASARYRRLATTIDDARARRSTRPPRLLGLGFPGGPAVERRQRRAIRAVTLPRPLIGTRRTAFLLRRARKARCCGRAAGNARRRRYRRSFQQPWSIA